MTKPEPDGPAFAPFADAVAVLSVGALAFENGPDRIAVHGTLDITQDAVGLAQARALKAAVDAIVATLEATDLPIGVAERIEAPGTARNPFA